MLRFLRLTLCLLCVNLVIGLAPLQAEESAQPVTANLVSEQTSIQPGHPFWVVVQLKMEPHWHTYWKNPGDAGMAPAIRWKLPEGFKVETLLWPTPQRFHADTLVGFGYDEEILLLAQIVPPETYPQGEVAISGEICWVVCSEETCLPGDAVLALNLPIGPETPPLSMEHKELFKQARGQIPTLYTSGPASRNGNSVEIVVEGTDLERHQIQRVEYFPEEKKTIDYKTSPVMEINHDGQRKIVLKESHSASSLKGVLVLHTDLGKASYHINVPIVDTIRDEQMVSIAEKHPVAHSQEHMLPSSNSFEFEGGVPLALLFAFVGGLLLNLMPCVLPVISFKVMSFIKLAGQSRKLILQHGLAFSFGVLLSFWVLAGLLLVLQAYGRSVGWGFQLQEPIFVAILASFIFVFALSLFGVFEMGTSVMSVAGQAQQSKHRSALIGSFLSGILATAVATPCTGPFLGSAVGYAVTLPALPALLIFTSLGLGMSFPYLALAAFPALLRFLPKPGPWMITFKELMGFFMMATVVWLVWVFSAQTSSMSVAVFMGGLFLLSVAAWVYGRWAVPLCKKLTRAVATAIALCIFVIGGYTIVVAATTLSGIVEHPSLQNVDGQLADAWEVYSPKRVAELRAQRTPVFIDFTAKWCLICQTNHMVLSTEDVSGAFASKGVVKMKADWTRNDSVIAGELRKFGRNSVPLYVLYGNEMEAPPVILPQVLTAEIVLESLNKLPSSEK